MAAAAGASPLLGLVLLLQIASGSAGAEAADQICEAPVGGKGGAQPVIYDISMPLRPQTVKFEHTDGLGNFMNRLASFQNGDDFELSNIRELEAHTGTHVDAPSHYLKDAVDAGVGVESLSLETLNGPALVVEVPHDHNITGEALADLPIPPGVKRIIFKTANTARGLLHQTAFDDSYTAVTTSGAQFLVDKTQVEMVGIDALSVASFAEIFEAHRVLLRKGIIPVEGLLLDNVAPGLYDVHCLHVNLVGSDGAPARCILIG